MYRCFCQIVSYVVRVVGFMYAPLIRLANKVFRLPEWRACVHACVRRVYMFTRSRSNASERNQTIFPESWIMARTRFRRGCGTTTAKQPEAAFASIGRDRKLLFHHTQASAKGNVYAGAAVYTILYLQRGDPIKTNIMRACELTFVCERARSYTSLVWAASARRESWDSVGLSNYVLGNPLGFLTCQTPFVTRNDDDVHTQR